MHKEIVTKGRDGRAVLDLNPTTAVKMVTEVVTTSVQRINTI